jgi:hypothetical protein
MATPSSLWLNDRPAAASTSAELYQYVVDHVPVLTTSPRRDLEVDAKTVYVFQREFAVVDRWQSLTLGSDRATTCHLLAAHSPSTAFLAHLDGAAGQMPALLHALRDAFDDEHILEVNLVGGFDDARGLSRQLGMELLWTLRNAVPLWPAARFHLRTCTIGPHNTTSENGEPTPRIRGLAIRTGTIELIPGAWFPDPQPHRLARAAMAFAGSPPLASVYNRWRATYQVDLGELTWQPVERLAALLAITDDEEFLQATSTSPRAEHAEYCDEMREMLRYLLWLQTAR